MEHILERAVLKASGRAITSDLVAVEEFAAIKTAKESDFAILLSLPYRESVQSWERLLVERAMKQANGNKAEAARLLGTHRRLLYDKLSSEDL